MRRIYIGYLTLVAILISSCSWQGRANETVYIFPQSLQPLYIEPVDNFKDAQLRQVIAQRFCGYNVGLTQDRTQANTILRLSHIQRATDKAVTNNVANNQSIFYKSQYNATVSISFSEHLKRKPFTLQVVTNTPVILLENQNVFSSPDTEQTFQELQNELSNQITRQVFFALQTTQSSSTSTKKSI